MKISVIIPTYKPKQYLWECLDSLVKQTFSKKDFEVILVLNGCTEPWKKEIENYIATEMHGMNVNFIHIEQGGVSNARNIALDNAKGEYITFIDDDDYVSSCYLQELLKNSDSKTIALAKPIAFDDITSCTLNYRITSEYYKCYHQNNKNFNAARRFFSGPWMKLIPRNYIGKRRFSPKFKNGEDTLFMYLISDKYSYVSCASEQAVYYRRYRQNSAVTMKRSLFNRMSNGLRLFAEVLKIYIPNFWKYNLRFTITTAASTINGIFHY